MNSYKNQLKNIHIQFFSKYRQYFRFFKYLKKYFLPKRILMQHRNSVYFGITQATRDFRISGNRRNSRQLRSVCTQNVSKYTNSKWTHNIFEIHIEPTCTGGPNTNQKFNKRSNLPFTDDHRITILRFTHWSRRNLIPYKVTFQTSRCK